MQEFKDITISGTSVNIEEIKAFLRENQSKKRYTHSVNVAEECLKLANRYGEDPQRAYFAGLVHDICKEFEPAEQRELAVNSNLNVEKAEILSKPLWHAIAGAAYVRDRLKINDSELLNAIRFHTIGHGNMTVFEKIVYIADAISAERDFDGVDKLRQLSYNNIDNAVLECIKLTIVKVINKMGYLPNYTFEAYNHFLYKTGLNVEFRRS